MNFYGFSEIGEFEKTCIANKFNFFSALLNGELFLIPGKNTPKLPRA